MFDAGKAAVSAAMEAGPGGTVAMIQSKIAAMGVSGNAVAGCDVRSGRETIRPSNEYSRWIFLIQPNDGSLQRSSI